MCGCGLRTWFSGELHSVLFRIELTDLKSFPAYAMLCHAMLCYAMLFVTVNFREVMEANPAVGKKVFRSVIGQKKIMNIQYTVHI